MQMLVISDTHGDGSVLSRILLKHPLCELVIHCGDGERELDDFLELHPDWRSRCYHVCGNCDSTERSPRILTLDLPYGHRVTAVHGHYYLYGDIQNNLIQLAKSQGSDLMLFGHFHTRCDTVIDGVHLFSPGSAACPRDGKPAAYGLIDILKCGILTSHGEVSLL